MPRLFLDDFDLSRFVQPKPRQGSGPLTEIPVAPAPPDRFSLPVGNPLRDLLFSLSGPPLVRSHPAEVGHISNMLNALQRPPEQQRPLVGIATPSALSESAMMPLGQASRLIAESPGRFCRVYFPLLPLKSPSGFCFLVDGSQKRCLDQVGSG